MSCRFLNRVKETVESNGLIGRGETILLAVSGGIDSMVMLDLLSRLAREEEYELKLVIAHMNHNLRGDESLRDLDFVRAAATKAGLDFFEETLKEGEISGSIQGGARRLRHLFLKDVATRSGASRIALAHNLDDRAETVLMSIFRGASLKGLSSMPPKRGSIIRPLLGLKREDIEEYAEENDIAYVSDSSNDKTVYLRNKVRKILIPLIENDYSPQVKDRLSELSERSARDSDFIDTLSLKLFERALLSEDKGRIELDRTLLIEAHEALSTRVLLEAARRLKGESAGLYSSHIGLFLSVLNGDAPNGYVELPFSITVSREYERLVIERKDGLPKALNAGFEILLNLPGSTAFDDVGGSVFAEVLSTEEPINIKGHGPMFALFDMEELDELIKAGTRLRLRSLQPGDRMEPLGMKGRKKLKDIFIDAKIPAARRRVTPILVAGDEILWVAGLRQSEKFKVTGSTRLILRVELLSPV